ncbi:NYN domain-containing protein [Deltaproteobacteria bacterium OttesenSCG-928-K17]|nr:NYN domain-containing protein [Deltaproteobacteria bacterium OttesenSCG-928-K17]
MKTAFLIDGFNFYYSIKRLDVSLKWFDFQRYCAHFLSSRDEIHSIYYFSALATWRPNSAARHRVFIEALRHYGIHVVLGEFKDKTKWCANCRKSYKDHEEKATDVNIALYAYRLASQPDIDRIVLVSGDTDMIPAIRLIKQDFPTKEPGVIFPYMRKNDQLGNEVSFRRKTSAKILPQFQLPESITLSSGKVITRPPEWS